MIVVLYVTILFTWLCKATNQMLASVCLVKVAAEIRILGMRCTMASMSL